MDDKNNVSHIEEQPTQAMEDSTRMELIRENGIVLIPQPTADPNGRHMVSLESRSLSC
jgi:hypothetical protein